MRLSIKELNAVVNKIMRGAAVDATEDQIDDIKEEINANYGEELRIERCGSKYGEDNYIVMI